MTTETTLNTSNDSPWITTWGDSTVYATPTDLTTVASRQYTNTGTFSFRNINDWVVWDDTVAPRPTTEQPRAAPVSDRTTTANPWVVNARDIGTWTTTGVTDMASIFTTSGMTSESSKRRELERKFAYTVHITLKYFMIDDVEFSEDLLTMAMEVAQTSPTYRGRALYGPWEIIAFCYLSGLAESAYAGNGSIVAPGNARMMNEQCKLLGGLLKEKNDAKLKKFNCNSIVTEKVEF